MMPALNEAPPVQPHPHWAEEQGEDGAVWRDDDIPVLAQEEAVILDFNVGPDVWPLGFPGLEEWLQEPHSLLALASGWRNPCSLFTPTNTWAGLMKTIMDMLTFMDHLQF